ncbi:hypothetical protein OJAV_G00134940 [Oryzias javanicus]|uniref:Uncharacterized protein n=1 Tax=Oryzias javanicus TaxID=123683 RepID=A0A3S2PZD5_ORYJA|nr:hypothetical protein OJAV_G00134940 [Oryzias javanicus]
MLLRKGQSPVLSRCHHPGVGGAPARQTSCFRSRTSGGSAALTGIRDWTASGPSGSEVPTRRGSCRVWTNRRRCCSSVVFLGFDFRSDGGGNQNLKKIRRCAETTAPVLDPGFSRRLWSIYISDLSGSVKTKQ